MSDASIYLDGRHYDRMFPPSDEIVEFCVGHARAARGPVLELACGTGSLAIPIAREGFEVTGLDSAPGMLEVARAKSARDGCGVEWVEADMRTFALGRRFDLVLLSGNAICHLLDRRSVEDCLARVREHLTADGRFVLTVFVPDPRLLLPESSEPAPFASYEDPDGAGRIEVTHTYRYESHTQIKRITTRHRSEAGAESLGTLDMRMFFPQELDALLIHNGFEIVEKAGDFGGRAFGAGSPMQLLHCRVP